MAHEQKFGHSGIKKCLLTGRHLTQGEWTSSEREREPADGNIYECPPS